MNRYRIGFIINTFRRESDKYFNIKNSKDAHSSILYAIHSIVFLTISIVLPFLLFSMAYIDTGNILLDIFLTITVFLLAIALPILLALAAFTYSILQLTLNRMAIGVVVIILNSLIIVTILSATIVLIT